ncbi:hypothetical protein LPJ63_000124 [Coemansia sp. RSA 2711]|nr:hypothetical protein LPJ63_000124 [Coemansia sp. RSA 2711]KAJ2314661.1 hypothetical protein IWW52_004226 [Coemansia sp. RSA 2704]KAJ2724811.1 hypothetical protein H4R23_004216 [Coemansia sp. Cherry 401B]
MEAALTPSEGAPSIGSTDKGNDTANNGFEDSRSETSTVDSDSDEADVSRLTFFTRLYELPVVSDAVSGVRQIAASNRYTGALIGSAGKLGALVDKSRPLLAPVERPLAALDGLAVRSLDLVEARYPIVARPTAEVLESVQAQCRAVEQRYPLVARTFAVARDTASSALDRVDYLVDYVLPPSEASSDSEGSPEPSEPPSPLSKVTVLVHKVPRRLGKCYYAQLQSSKAAISGLTQTVEDTATVYKSELGERSLRLLGSVHDRMSAAVNSTIPSYLPLFAQPYYTHGKEILTTKAAKLHAEYARDDRDPRTRVLNLILIGGEHVPVLEGITARIFGKGMAASPAATPAASAAVSPGSIDEKAA